MYSSRCLQSEVPFKAIWVAAYFHSKLKKSQIVQTDIVSTVDKILQDDFGVITYRVLAYLLLGVVRIHSKKVGYMFNDCQEVVNRIKEFISRKQTSHADTIHAPYISITLPDRFELDAFDLDIIEDSSRSNVMPNEAITLKDTTWKNLGMVQFSLDKYQFEFSAPNKDSCFLDDDPPDEDFLSPYMMDGDIEVGTSGKLSHLEASLEKFRDIKFSEEECVNLEKFYGVEEEPPIPVEPVDENHHGDGKEIEISKMADLEAQSPMETSMGKLGDCGFSTEDCLNHETFSRFHEKPPEIVNTSGENSPSNVEQIKIPEMTMMFTGFHENPLDLVKPFDKDCLNIEIPEEAPLESGTPQVIEDEINHSNLLSSMEKLKNIALSHEVLPRPDIFCRDEEEPAKTVLQHDEEKHHTDVLREKDLEMASSEDIRCQINVEGQSSSFTPDVTPKSKFFDPSACATPKFMVLPTPTTMKSIQKRKRKCIIDDPIVLSNQVIKKSLEDPSDLLSKRRKVQKNLLAIWKTNRNSSFRHSFLEPLLNYSAVELRSLFSTKKLEIPESMDLQKATEEFPESIKTAEPSAMIVGSADTVEAAEKILDSIETSDTPRQLSVSVSPLNDGRIEEPQFAPETPIQQASPVRFMVEPQIAPETPIRQTSLVRSFGSFKESPFNSDAIRPASLCEDQDLGISLINEEISSRYEVNEEQDVSPGRSRMVRILKQRSREETLNLSNVLNRRTKKDSAKLFYEILVLKSGGYLDVVQDCAYGDIRIQILPKWDQIDGAC